MVDSPGSARDTLSNASDAFKTSESNIEDYGLQDEAKTVSQDLDYFTGDLADYQYASPATRDASTIKADLAQLRTDLATLSADGR